MFYIEYVKKSVLPGEGKEGGISTKFDIILHLCYCIVTFSKEVFMEYNVFICYRGGESSTLASNIYSDLCLYTNNRLKIFFAPRCVPRGDNFKDACITTAGEVTLMMLVLSKGFFDDCKNSGDIVYQELKSALKNPDCKFLPIIMPDFDFKNENLTDLFDDTEIDRIKHISAIKFTDVYSFSSVEMLIPILKDKIGDLYVDNRTKLTDIDTAKKRMHIGDDGKDSFFSDKNETEKERLKAQQELLMKFDMPIYDNCLNGKSGLNVLDLGCGNGVALMNRLGNRKEVSKIIGIEYDAETTEHANQTYGSDRVKFYCLDIEAENFKDSLLNVMKENGIEQFDFVNFLAVMSHFKSPFKVLRTVKSCCAKGARIFIRNIDDGLNIFYPDEENKFARALSLLPKCDTTGYRYSGRELYTLLKRSGYHDIVLEKMGLSSVGMDYDEKAAFFDIIFKFIKQGISKAAFTHPNDMQLKADCRWLEDEYDDLEEKFLSDEFFMNFGFILYTAKA